MNNASVLTAFIQTLFGADGRLLQMNSFFDTEHEQDGKMTYLRKRNLFLGSAGGIALVIGLMAALLPETFLALKGVAPIASTVLWMRETGLLLVALGGFAFAVRKLPPSPFMFRFLAVNVAVQLGLLTFEIVAYKAGILTGWASIVPSSLLNVMLAVGFLLCLLNQPQTE
jgi:hypothetical protein